MCDGGDRERVGTGRGRGESATTEIETLSSHTEIETGTGMGTGECCTMREGGERERDFMTRCALIMDTLRTGKPL